MKQIKILIFFLLLGFAGQAQFANTDSIRSYIDKYIRTNPTSAFQNNRLNTALKGIASYLDSVDARVVGGVRVVDSLWKYNDTTLAFKIKGVTHTISGIGGGEGGGGIIYKEGFKIDIRNDTISAIPDTLGVRRSLDFDAATKAFQLKNDTVSNPIPGVPHVYGFDATNTRRFFPAPSGGGMDFSSDYVELRTKAAAADTANIYDVIIRGIPSRFVYDPNDVTSADDTAMVIVSGGRRLKRYVEDFINVKWFGATGNGVSDDWRSIQKALNYINNNPNVPRTLFFPRGTYNISQPIIGYKWNGTNYQFVNFELRGESVAGFTDPIYNTVIKATFNDKFAIGIQLGKTCRIKGLYISGMADGWLTFASYYEMLQRGFDNFMNGGTRDEQHTPYSGIIIDPFTQSVASAPADAWPGGYAAWNRGTGSTGGSSAITIEDCRVYGFTVAIATSINGSTFNSESCNFNNITVGYCKVGFAFGHDQLKDNHVRTFIAWDNVYRVFDNHTYGRGFGNIPYIDGGDIAGNVVELVSFFDAGRYPVYIANVFAEGLFRVGDIVSPQMSTLKDCTFDFVTAIPGFPSPKNYMKSENLYVTGCYFRIYDNSSRRINFDANRTFFTNCTFQSSPITRLTQPLSGVILPQFQDCPLTITGGVRGASNTVVANNTGEHTYVLGKFVLQDEGIQHGRYKREYNEAESEYVFPVYTSVATTVDTSNFTASFTATADAVRSVYVDAYLLGYLNGTGDPFVCHVTAVNKTTGLVSLDDVPLDMRNGNYTWSINISRTVGVPFIGDVTSGSATIINVDFTNTAPTAGQHVESGYFGVSTSGPEVLKGAYIVSVNVGARTITMSHLASSTATGISFVNGTPKITMFSSVPSPELAGNQFYLEGTEYLYRSTTDQVSRYKFRRGGMTIATGGQHQADWYYIPDIKFVGTDDIRYWDPLTLTYRTIGGSTGVTRDANGNIVQTGAVAGGQYNFILNSTANASYDNNLIHLGSTSQTGGFLAGSTPAFSAANGAFLAFRGNTYSASGDQRGNVYLASGQVSGASAAEAALYFYSNGGYRAKIDKDGLSTWQGRIEYASDLSGSYTARTLVDKGWVDAQLAALGGPAYTSITSVPQTTLLGRYTTSTGAAQAITLGSGLSLNSSTGVLTASSAAYEGEDVTLITASYSVPTTSKIINVFFNGSTGQTITLPTGSGADKMVIWFHNTSVNTVTFSESIFESSGTSFTTIGNGQAIKLIYKNADSKWYGIVID